MPLNVKIIHIRHASRKKKYDLSTHENHCVFINIFLGSRTTH